MSNYRNYDAKWTYYPDEFDAYSEANAAAYPGVVQQGSGAYPGVVQQGYEAQQHAPDVVRQPAHYARFVIEPATFNAANNLPFDVGNVVKYVCRFDAKNGREDLKKASRYIEMIIERLDREDRVKAGENARAVWAKML